MACGETFQSTHPVRGATVGAYLSFVGSEISIHAPREGCDSLRCPPFNWARTFQSTHPVRGATAGMDFASQDTDTPTTP